MSRFRARRAFAGFILAALLVAAPARAAGFSEPWLHVQDLWSRAWSWLTDLWPAHPPDAADPQARGKDSTGPPPNPPNPPDPPKPGCPRPPGWNGDSGPGADPDG
jgi:hypothetical protein